ncbi:transcriptional regulator [Streptomyces sp. NPDC056600]|uniref:transcriptional regulator n=1 Tax=Streptomyces sp. NPDC056600 TaxID=3345874 RepID=UPI0036A458BE
MTVHAPNRLRVCALLDATGEAEFGLVQRQLGLSASALSKHAGVLMEAGYVEQRKAVRDTRQRVWLRLTRRGREAYQGHLAALRAIVGSSGPDL